MLESLHKRSTSWGVKVILGMIVVVFIFWGIGGLNSESKNVLATVDGQPIPLPDFMRRLHQERERLRAANPALTPEMLNRMDFRRQILQNMIAETLIAKELKRLEITVSPAELKAAILAMPQFRDKSGAFSEEKYTAFLAAQGMSASMYESLLEQDLLQGKLARILQAAAAVSPAQARAWFMYAAQKRAMEYFLFDDEAYLETARPAEDELRAWYDAHSGEFTRPREITVRYVAVSPEILSARYQPQADELAAFYEENADRLFRAEELVRARHILIGGAEADAREKAEGIARRLKGGEDFARLAMEASQDTASAQSGGDLGWFGRGKMVPEFEEVVFSLKPGEVSDVFSTDFGWHIAKLEERQDERVRPLEEVRQEAAAAYALEKAQAAFQDILDAVLDGVLSGKSLEESAAAQGLATATAEGLTVENAPARLAMTPEDVEALFLTPAGVPSDRLFAHRDGYLLAVVEAERPAFVEPFEAVRDTVLAEVRQEKAARLAHEAAQAAAGGLAQGVAPAGKEALTSAWFGREGVIPGLGLAPDVVQAIFEATNEAWLPQAYAVPGGSAVVRLKGVEEPAEAEWEQVSGLVRQSLALEQEQQAYRALVQALWDKAEIRIRMPELLRENTAE